MAKNFKELRAGMSVKAKAASAAEHRRLMEEMSLLQLRKAREVTQTKIADELHIWDRVMYRNWNGARTCMSARLRATFRRSARIWRFAQYFPTDAR